MSPFLYLKLDVTWGKCCLACTLSAAKASSLAAESVRVGIVSKLVSWVQICNNQGSREYITAISK